MTDHLCSPEIKETERKIYCYHCKKRTRSGMQDFYDDIFCMDCKMIKGRI